MLLWQLIHCSTTALSLWTTFYGIRLFKKLVILLLNRCKHAFHPFLNQGWDLFVLLHSSKYPIPLSVKMSQWNLCCKCNKGQIGGIDPASTLNMYHMEQLCRFSFWGMQQTLCFSYSFFFFFYQWLYPPRAGACLNSETLRKWEQ